MQNISFSVISFLNEFELISLHTCIVIVSIKLLETVVDSDQKASFSIATTRRCKEGSTPFLGLLHFTLDMYLILLSVKQGVINTILKVFGMT